MYYFPAVPHSFHNEDNHRYAHMGYTEKPCKVCNKPFIVGIESVQCYDTCGRDNCDRHGLVGGTSY